MNPKDDAIGRYSYLMDAIHFLKGAGVLRPELRVTPAEWNDLRMVVEVAEGFSRSRYPEPLDTTNPRRKAFWLNGLLIVADE